MPTYSIVVPVYNAQDSVSRCLDSLLKQDFSDFEVLLIDDGSKDDSLRVCQQYAEKDSRVRVFHQENQGVSAARNFGLLQASGEYIGFVDSDDYVTEDYFSLLPSVEEHKPDLVLFGYQRVHVKTGEVIQSLSVPRQPMSKSDFNSRFFDLWTNAGLPYVWNKFFRADMIRKDHLAFRLDMSYGEDFVFVMEFLSRCDQLFFTGGTPYCYVEGTGVSLSSKLDLKKKEYFQKMDEVLLQYFQACKTRVPKERVYNKFFERYLLLMERICLDRTIPYRDAKKYMQELLSFDYWKQINPYIKPQGKIRKAEYWMAVHHCYWMMAKFLRFKEFVKGTVQ